MSRKQIEDSYMAVCKKQGPSSQIRGKMQGGSVTLGNDDETVEHLPMKNKTCSSRPISIESVNKQFSVK